MSLRAWIAHAVGGRRDGGGRVRLGRMVRPLALDRWRDYPADGLTPSRLVTLLRAADDGAVDQAMALFQQMEEKDAHLHSVANTRRLALTGLGWEIVSAVEVREGVDRTAADEAADHARGVLADIEGFDEALQHLSMAMGRNVAVAENVYDVVEGELRLTDVIPVGFERLAFDAYGRVRILTEQEPQAGIELPAHKFVVHTPHTACGHPMRGGLLRVSALSYLGKHYAMKDWMVFAEVFGMPVRVARYEPSATPEEKQELLGMLRSLGTDASAVFSKAVELQLLEAGQGKSPPPYESMCNFFNRELSKAWLGGTLTVETSGQTGTFSTAQIHDEVRLDLRQDDMAKEARTIRRDVLAPITRLQFGPGAPVPFFRRRYEPPHDLRELAGVLDIAVNDLGMAVPDRWARHALGVPVAAEGEAVLHGKPPG
ncbi:MAG: DUF935 family protein [Phycisphaerae bacterium]|nr:DUF935 family protein [Phycisphaerae bacterium]